MDLFWSTPVKRESHIVTIHDKDLDHLCSDSNNFLGVAIDPTCINIGRLERTLPT